jgi:hypothetical protein
MRVLLILGLRPTNQQRQRPLTRINTLKKRINLPIRHLLQRTRLPRRPPLRPLNQPCRHACHKVRMAHEVAGDAVLVLECLGDGPGATFAEGAQRHGNADGAAFADGGDGFGCPGFNGVGFAGGLGDAAQVGEDGERRIVCKTGVDVLADGACDGWYGGGETSVELGEGLGDESVALL